MQLVDLSHPILDQPTCALDWTDRAPQLSFQQGNAGGGMTITARLDNLAMDYGTHLSLPGSNPASAHGGVIVGEIPLERCQGHVLVVDVTTKLATIAEYFHPDGRFAVDPRDQQRCLAFLQRLDEIEITDQDIGVALRQAGATLAELHGLLFLSGLSRFWAQHLFQRWEYLYYFNPFLSSRLCRHLVDSGVGFLGIDGLQLEHPAANLSGQELPFVLHSSCRRHLEAKRRSFRHFSVTSYLLAQGLLLYHNLNIPVALAGQPVQFFGVPLNLRIPGAVTGSVVRPFVLL